MDGTPDRKQARVEWTFRVICGPECEIAEIPVWGSALNIDGPRPEHVRYIAELAAVQFAETLSRALGLEATATVKLKVHDE